MRFLLVFALLISSTIGIRANIYTVQNTMDSGTGSLRQAITDAETNPGQDTVNFAVGTDGMDIVLNSSLNMNGQIVLKGNGMDKTSIVAGGAFDVFLLSAGTYEIRDLKVKNGQSAFIQSAAAPDPIKFEQVEIESCSVNGVLLTQEAGAVVEFKNCLIHGCGENGVRILGEGAINSLGSTFLGNGKSGFILAGNPESYEFSNNTFHNNVDADNLGALSVRTVPAGPGQMVIRHNTIHANQQYGYQVDDITNNAEAMKVHNNIIWGNNNTDYHHVGGTGSNNPNEIGGNIIGTCVSPYGCPSWYSNSDPQFVGDGPKNWGGVVPTILIANGGPAHDNGNPLNATGTGARGEQRDEGPDIGAVELCMYTATATSANVTCFGAANGSLTANPVGGQGSFTYQWVVSGNTNQIATGLGATTDSCIVLESPTNCPVVTNAATVVEPADLTLSRTGVNVTCFGASNGSVTVTASGGVSPYQYSTDGATWQGSNVFNGLSAGNYTIKVKDVNNCLDSAATITLTQPTDVTYTYTVDSVSCFGGSDGQVNVTASGGTPAYQYSPDEGSTWQAGNTFTGPIGQLAVMVQDANGCTSGVNYVDIHQPTQLSVSATSSNVDCNGASTGSITLTGSGGTMPYQYSNDGGSTFQGGSTFGSLAAGTFNLRLQDGKGCTADTNGLVITEQSLIVITVDSIHHAKCNGSSDGEVFYVASGGQNEFSFSIDSGATWNEANGFAGLAAGSYYPAVQDGFGCEMYHSVTVVNEPAVLTVNATPTPITCNGSSDGIVTAAGTGGTAPYQYSIDGGTTWQAGTTFSGLAVGSYTINIQDANSCTAISSAANITEPAVVTFSLTADSVNCKGASDGNISVSATGGVSPYQYSIDGVPTWQSSANFTGLAVGAYGIHVQDANSCVVGPMNINVYEPNALVASASDVDVLCNGNATGSITAGAVGGVAPYQFSIDGGTTYQGSNTFIGLAAGTYNVRVQDSKGCTNDTTGINITQPGALLVSGSGVDPLCNGGTDGSVSLSGSGGLGPYQYSIDGGTTWQSSASFVGLVANTYTPSIQDANGCISTGTGIVLNNPATLSVTGTPTDVTCNGLTDGQLVANIVGGTAPYQYSIDGGTTFQSGATFTGLDSAIYIVTVQDANGCSGVSSNVIVSEPDALTVTLTPTDVTCFGLSDGFIAAVGSGGNAPYQYSVDGGATYQSNDTIQNLIANIYILTIQDANGCTTNNNATVGQPNALTFSAALSNPNCNGDNSGVINMTALGGVAAYDFSIDSGATYQASGSFTGIGAGSFDGRVRDANGCIYDSVLVLTEPAVLVGTETVTNISCNSANDGQIAMGVTGGTASYQFSIDTGATYQSAATFTGLQPGDYSIIAEDANGCKDTTSTITIVEPALANVNDSLVMVSCFGGADGEIHLNVTGGTAPFEFSIDGGATYQSSNFFTGFAAGTYSVTVRDANLCTSIAGGINITEPTALQVTASTTPTTCIGSADGTVTVAATGGTAPYQYGLNGQGLGANNVFNGVAAGNVTVNLSDANGCLLDSTGFPVGEPTPIVIDEAGVNVSDATCTGDDGEITGLSVSGGAGGYTYSWSGITSTASPEITGAGPGVYHLIVTDAAGCVDSSSAFTIQWIATPLTVVMSSTDASCNGGFNGTADASVSGGTTPYTFQWSEGSVSSSVNGLGAGAYTVTVSDVNGCEGYGSVTVNEPSTIDITISTTDATCTVSNGTATVDNVTGGTSPYTFYWSTGETTDNVSDLGAGPYMVMVTDQNGCSNSSLLNIGNGSMTLSFNGTSPSCHEGGDGEIDLAVSGGSGVYTYFWDYNGETSEDLIDLVGDAFYGVTVEDDQGCVASETYYLADATPIDFSSFTMTPATCGVNDGTLSVTVGGGTPGYTYLWDDSAATDTSALLAAYGGAYQLVVTDGNGCADSSSYVIDNSGAPTIILNEIIQPTCNQYDGKVFVTITPAGNYTYEWKKTSLPNDPVVSTNEDFVLANIGDYHLIVDDGMGCNSVLFVDMPGVNLEPQEICMVTVEEDNGQEFNRVVWEKNVNLGIEFYEVYRESQGTWQLINTQPISDLSQFDDLGASPGAHAYKYRLKTIDGCGNSSVFEAEHKTIHLTAELVGDDAVLNWDAYEGVFGFTGYTVERITQVAGGNASTSDIATVPGGILTYTDTLVPDTANTTITYVVRVDFTEPCTAEKAVDHNNTRSNRGNIAVGGGDLVFSIDEIGLEAVVYPNPTSDVLNIEVNTTLEKQILLYGIDGKLLHSSTEFSDRIELDLSSFERGIYLLQIGQGNHMVTKRVIVQ